MEDLNTKIQIRANRKIQNSEFILSGLQQEGTRLGVLTVDANEGFHQSAGIELRSEKLIEEVSNITHSLLFNKYHKEFHTSHYEWNVRFLKDSWDNNQRKAIEINSFIFDMLITLRGVDHIDTIVRELCKSTTFISLLSNLYNCGITDIVFSSLMRLNVYNYFLYNIRPTESNLPNRVFNLPFATGEEDYFLKSDFDRFKSLVPITKQNFTFLPTRYEIWRNGKLEDSGETDKALVVSTVYTENKELMRVDMQDQTLHKYISDKQYFDDFISQHDRLQLVTAPMDTNISSDFLSMYPKFKGYTRERKIFGPNDSYCCNIFLKTNEIVKVSFVFASPDKVVEFYR